MSVRKTDILSFNTGIEDILSEDITEGLFLPKDVDQLLPSELEAVRTLESIFKDPSIEGFLLEGMKPEVTHKDVLLPGKYRALMYESAEVFKKMAETDGKTSEVFQNASELFKQEKENLELLKVLSNIILKA